MTLFSHRPARADPPARAQIHTAPSFESAVSRQRAEFKGGQHLRVTRVAQSPSLLFASVASCPTLRSRSAVWNAALHFFCLDFGGRVAVASTRNLQLLDSTDAAQSTLLQFGRTAQRDTFILDYRAPLSAVDAFALALTRLT